LIFTLLSKIVSGAVVGYITNDLAIQMLCRKRFGLGGIVIRTKDALITNVSKFREMVKRIAPLFHSCRFVFPSARAKIHKVLKT
jgi:hypothetical protein